MSPPDPIVKYMSKEQLQKAIERTRKQMVEAAKKMDFIEAAQYRDELIKLEDLYQKTTIELPEFMKSDTEIADSTVLEEIDTIARKAGIPGRKLIPLRSLYSQSTAQTYRRP